jgi:membrane associated rhomboid family serine protease
MPIIPLADATRRPVRFPLVTVTLVAANVVAFLWEIGTSEAAIVRFAVVPADLLQGRGAITPLTAMFLHAGFMHIIGNMLFLSVFAPAIEDAMGRGKFLAFYLLGGLAATAAQVAVAPGSTIPQLGASGAIAAVMGAFLVTFPRDRIKVLWFLGIFVQVAYLPAFALVGVWLLTQLLNQTASVVHADSGGVAYMAHLGGAFFGILTARFFEGHARRMGVLDS